LIEIYSWSTFYDEVPVTIAVQQLRKARLIIVRTQAAPPAVATPRVDDDHGVTGHRMQRVGTAQFGGRSQVVARHCQAHRVDIAAQRSHPTAAQCGQFGADRAGRVVHQPERSRRQPPGPVPGDRRRRGLLQRLVGEEPVRRLKIWTQPLQLVCGTTAQQGRLHQDRRPVAESGTRRGDIRHPGGVGQLEFSDRRQRHSTLWRPQVSDVVRAEGEASGDTAQEGLTPVTITL